MCAKLHFPSGAGPLLFFARSVPKETIAYENMPYERRTLSILLCMIVTGALRSVAVKLLYQIGLSAPFFITLLYLSGQSLSLVVHFVGRRLGIVEERLHVVEQAANAGNGNAGGDIEPKARVQKNGDEGYAKVDSEASEDTFDNDEHVEPQCNGIALSTPQHAKPPMPPPNRQRSGSLTGLAEESSEAVSYIHKIPHSLKPAVPGLFNLINSGMRWASLVFVPASTAEMLISGLELILSTVAARLIRKRMISMQRWGGVCIVAVGLIVVRLSEISPASDDSGDENDLFNSTNMVNEDDIVAEEEASIDNDAVLSEQSETQITDRLIGDILIVGQCIMSVLQDLAEELFMHEAELSPTLLLGWEGIFGLAFGLPLYLPLAPLLGEDPSKVWSLLQSSKWILTYVIGLILIFTTTGVFNIVSTSVTSSMTRNIWKNFRSLVVWILGLCIYYSSGNESLGEEWKAPSSFVTLLGFATMLGGVCLYYRTRKESNGTGACDCQWGRMRYSVVNIEMDGEPSESIPSVELANVDNNVEDHSAAHGELT